MSFLLKNVVPAEVDARYGLAATSGVVRSTPLTDACALSDLLTVDSTIFVEVGGAEGSSIRRCFWDHHPFPVATPAIGCPIEYLPYQNSASVGHYTLLFYTTSIERKYASGRMICPSSFRTYGVFCSFQCLAAFARANRHDKRFEFSSLLLPMYVAGFGVNETDSHTLLKPAPDYTLLVEYGGPLTIDQFRHGFKGTSFVYTGPVCQRFVSSYRLDK